MIRSWSPFFRLAVGALFLARVLPAQQPVLQSSLPSVSASVVRTAHTGLLPPQTANLSSSTSTQIAYTASTTQSWIQLGGSVTGTTPSSLTIGANLATLPPGTYYGSVVINAPSAAGGGLTIPVTVTILPFIPTTSGALAPTSGSPFATGSGPRAVVVSDFNGDGKTDIATANFNDNSVTVLLGNGLGGFTAASGSPFAAGTGPVAIAAADFNNDGVVDLAIANNSANTVTVLLGNGSGGFTAAAGSPFASGANPVALAVGDFNHDRAIDIAVVNSGDSTVKLLLGNGAGGFTSQTTSVSTGPKSIAAGDFNGDGTPDVVIVSSNSGTSNTATVLLGGPSGFSVASGSPISLPAQPLAITVGDFNLDGKPDFAVGNIAGASGANALGVYLGAGNGTFTAGPTVTLGASGSQFSSILAGDIDGDGYMDLALTNGNTPGVNVLLGNGTGAFSLVPGTPIAVPSASAIALADFNFDARSDLVIASATSPGSAAVLLGTADLPNVTLTSSSGGSAVLSGSPVVLTATVAGAGLFLRMPIGAVTFMDGGSTLQTVVLASGSASLSTSTLAVGTHSITASYLGDTWNLAGGSNTVSVTVDSAAASIAVISGSPQTVNTNAQFAPLQVIVRDSGGVALAGVPVTFTAPASGAGGTFASTATVTSNAQGIATAPTFTANSIAGFFTVTASTSFPALSATFSLTSVAPVAMRFVPMTPCRVADTRNPVGPFGAPAITGQTTRNFIIPNSACSIPGTALAYSLNVAVVPQGPLGYLTLWPAGAAQPLVATLNSDGRIKSNAAIIPAGSGGAISVFATNTTDVVLDINGYFVAASSPTALSFYPLPPCRIADTRGAAGPLGGPFIPGVSTRSFPIQSSSCSVPSSAQAYSLNFAAVPRTSSLSFITVWPSGQAQPLAATLNAPTGAITANAALIPAGTGGAVSVYVTQDTDLVIDIDGYFAPAGSPGNLSLYSLEPCRILDSRLPQGSPPFSGVLNVTVASSVCGVPSSAQAFAINSTVVPAQGLGYLTLWAQGAPQPLVATLNSSDGAITGNLAVVPTTNGLISAFATNPTALVIDIFGFFAP